MALAWQLHTYNDSLPELSSIPRSLLITLANQGLEDAQVAYTRLLLQEGQLHHAGTLLARMPLTPATADLKAQYAIKNHNPKYVITLANQFSLNPTTLAKAKMALKAPLNSDEQALLGFQDVTWPNECQMRVLWLATGLKAQGAVKALKGALNQRHPGKVCFSGPRYISSHTLKCGLGKYGEARCDWLDESAAHLAASAQAQHVFVMAEHGLANVRGQVAYFSPEASVDVVMHELLHLYGFMDEYPISAQLAKTYCSGEGKKAINLWVGAPENAPKGWVPSRTCQGHGVASFKPVAEQTNMEFQSLALPNAYRAAFYQQIEDNAKSHSLADSDPHSLVID